MSVEYRGSRSTERRDRRIAAVASTQYSVFSRAQAIHVGFSTEQIDRRLGTGAWERLLPGVYRVAGAPPRGRQAAMAACLWAGSDAVVSHRAAGVLWQLDGFEATRIEISVPIGRKLRTEKLIVHRTSDLPGVDRATFAEYRSRLRRAR